jgi:hypothetical protein
VWLGEINRCVAPSYTPRVAGLEVTPADLTERIRKLQRLAAHV